MEEVGASTNVSRTQTRLIRLFVKVFQSNELVKLSALVLCSSKLALFLFFCFKCFGHHNFWLLCLYSCTEKENLCLYGHPDESWEVTLPAEEVPPELPEPALGINFARDGMNRKDWLSLVAVHSDCWLLSVAFYLGARLNRNER